MSYGISQSYLPPDRGSDPALTPAESAGTQHNNYHNTEKHTNSKLQETFGSITIRKDQVTAVSNIFSHIIAFFLSKVIIKMSSLGLSQHLVYTAT